MKIESIRIENFRSFKDETIYLDDYNCFIGVNGSGKSTILTALNILFRNSEGSADITTLTEEDFHQKNTKNPITITVTFVDLSNGAAADFKAYVRQDKLVLSVVASWDTTTQRADIKQHGSRMVNSQFAKYFKADEDKASAADLKEIYKKLTNDYPDLPNVTTKPDMQDALRNHEENNPEECELVQSQFEFYGWSKGANLLEKYIQWTYVPAVKDASEEQEEGKNTFLGTILQRTIRSKVDFDEDVNKIKEEMSKQYREMIGKQQDTLEQISEAVEGKLQEWAHPGAELKLEWFFDPNKSVAVSQPSARVYVGESGFLGEIPRMGHGLQRSFLVSLLQELAESNGENQPALILGFEEPELYQHPPQARHLAYVLEQLSTDNAQVLVTTHSPYFISGKGFESVRMTTRDKGSTSTKVTRITHKQISEILAKALKEKPAHPSAVMAAVEQIMQPSQNEMFFSKVPILVEGVEDVAFIATYLKMTDRWSNFRKLGCHFVVTGGKTNISRPLAIGISLGMPIFVVFDGDGDENNNEGQHRKDNGCLLNLCGFHDADDFPSQTLWEKNLTMWHTNIGNVVKEDVGAEKWAAAREKAKMSKGLTEGVKDKNALLVAGIVETLLNEGQEIDCLEKLSYNIISYATEKAAI